MKNLFQAFRHKGFLILTLLREHKREGSQVFILPYHLTLPIILNAPGAGTHEHATGGSDSITYSHTRLDINNVLRSLNFELISYAKRGNMTIRGLGTCITSVALLTLLKTDITRKHR